MALDVSTLRASIAFVPQETYLFNRSLRENIRYGELRATDREVEAAARAAGVHDFVTRLPKGYDTMVGEGGHALSGGERQRIAIARALLKSTASIVLLDEPTSALDPVTETSIEDTIATIAGYRTVLVVTHRLALASRADHILVLNHGCIVQAGTHADLMAAGGLYGGLLEGKGNTDSVMARARDGVPGFSSLS